ncbi:MAG: AI-2E family transporter [Candidatus Theseobacter exili]|nr:AI-2E family transporter [Candidatus Theseobacter exili]
MFFDNKPYTLDRIVRIGIGVGLIWASVKLLGYLSDVLIPFAIAVLLAYLMNPLVVLLQKKISNRLVAVLLSLTLVSGVLITLTILIIPAIVNEISQMGSMLSAFVTNANLSAEASKRLPPDLWQAIQNYAESKEVQDFFRTEDFWNILEAVAKKILPGIWGVIAGTASFFMGLIGLTIIGLYLVFLLLDFKKLSAGWQKLIPPNYRESVLGFISDFERAMSRYFRGQATVASIVGIMFALGFWMIGLPLGILLGLFIGLLNMVPYLQIIGLIPALLLAIMRGLESGSSFWMPVSLTAMVFIVVQSIQDTILVPKIMGRVTGLSPAIILLSLSIWGKLLGIFGLLIALPMTCLLYAYYQRFLSVSEIGQARLSSMDGAE